MRSILEVGSEQLQIIKLFGVQIKPQRALLYRWIGNEMNNAVDEFFTVHAPCKAAVQVLKKLMTVLKCLLKDLFKGEIGASGHRDRCTTAFCQCSYNHVHQTDNPDRPSSSERGGLAECFNPVSQQMIKTVIRAQMNVLTLHIADACTDFIRGDPVLVSGLDICRIR